MARNNCLTESRNTPLDTILARNNCLTESKNSPLNQTDCEADKCSVRKTNKLANGTADRKANTLSNWKSNCSNASSIQSANYSPNAWTNGKAFTAEKNDKSADTITNCAAYTVAVATTFFFTHSITNSISVSISYIPVNTSSISSSNLYDLATTSDTRSPADPQSDPKSVFTTNNEANPNTTAYSTANVVTNSTAIEPPAHVSANAITIAKANPSPVLATHDNSHTTANTNADCFSDTAAVVVSN